MARRWLIALCAMTVLVATTCADGVIAAGPRTSVDRGLELVGHPTRTVRFVAGEGRTVLHVRNASGRSGLLEIVFVSRSGDRVVVVPGRSRPDSQPVSVRDPNGLERPLVTGGVQPLELRFRLAADQAPSDGGGRIEVRMARGGAPPAVLAIRGAGPDISFDPPNLTIDVSQGCLLFKRSCGDTTTVLLRGRDAVLWARRTAAPRGVAILNNRHGGSVTVRLRDLDVRDGIVRLTVAASDIGEAGRYTGRLPLQANGIGGPSLATDVNVRWSLAAAVLAIFVGAVFGGFFLRRFEIRRRRRLLELELLSALIRYDEERARSGEKPAGFDLDRLLEPRRQDEASTIPYPGTRGVSALLWHIKTARDDVDFSEDIARTHALIAAIERWLALEPVARETAHLLDGDAPPARSGVELSDTIGYRDLAYLRMRATTAPADDDECERLIGALAAQGRVAAKCKVMWELLAELESRNGWLPEQARTMADLDVLALERGYPAFEHRTGDQTDRLLVTLGHAEDRLRRMHGDSATLDARPRVIEAQRIEDRLDGPSRNPAIEHAMLDLSPWRLRLAGAFSALALRSVVWTFARALVAAVAYALTIYSDTWGSVTDFASAFTAGFLTETFVNWAVMPALRSNRNRGTDPSRPEAPPPAGEHEARLPTFTPRLEASGDNGRSPPHTAERPMS